MLIFSIIPQAGFKLRTFQELFMIKQQNTCHLDHSATTTRSQFWLSQTKCFTLLSDLIYEVKYFNKILLSLCEKITTLMGLFTFIPNQTRTPKQREYALLTEHCLFNPFLIWWHWMAFIIYRQSPTFLSITKCLLQLSACTYGCF